MVEKFCDFCKTAHSYVYDSCYSVYELVIKVIEKIDELIDFVNGFQTQIDEKEDSSNITGSRQLSETGNFTGTLNGESVTNVLLQVDSNTELSTEIIRKIDDRESIGWVLDGGLFPDVEPPNYDFDGGVF